jgi:hypothetical protein
LEIFDLKADGKLTADKPDMVIEDYDEEIAKIVKNERI